MGEQGATVQVFKPPSRLPISIFLAGSIEMGAAPDWQAQVTEALRGLNAAVYNPRRDDWDSSWVQSIENSNFREQVEWELSGLDAADVIAMYIDPETKAPISLMELGLYARSRRLIVCCPDGFWRKGNVEVVCARYGVPLYHRFDDWLQALQLRVGHPL